ncbi:hypothetical protein [Cellulomonas sp. URHD0024]|nr:hypothetical protein [Cellulomonas sp. URHD0024]
MNHERRLLRRRPVLRHWMPDQFLLTREAASLEETLQAGSTEEEGFYA